MINTSNTIASASRDPNAAPLMLDQVPAARRRDLAGGPVLRLAVDRPPYDEKPDYARLAREAMSDRRSIEEQVLDRVTESLMRDVARVNRLPQPPPRMRLDSPASRRSFEAPQAGSPLRLAPSWKRDTDADTNPAHAHGRP